MKQKQLTEAIRDGLTQNREYMLVELNKALWKILGIIVLGLFLILLWNQYHNWRFPTQPSTTQGQSCFPYENLQCKIYQQGKYLKCQDGKIYPTQLYIETEDNSNISKISFNQMPCADVSDQIPIRTMNICGYQEANAWFELIKHQHEDKLIMECN